METWDLLKCDCPAGRLVQRPITPGDITPLARPPGERQALLFVVSEGSASAVTDALGRAGETVLRKTKNPRKGLKDCLPARPCVCCMALDYETPGKLEAGVRAVCRSEEFRNWRGILVLAARADVFSRLWELSAPFVNGMGGYDAWARRGDVSGLHDIIEQDFDHSEIPRPLTNAFVGESSVAHCVRRLIVVAARADCPVLVIGETGTGKEVVARQIHNLSNRRARPFVPVNCAAIASDLLESELFGHVRGAFTGADQDKPGLVDAAGSGTLFLDEVGDLDSRHQAKVLRLLETREYTKVGSTGTQTSSARVLAATNQDLGGMIEAGRFRADLYYRLISFPIKTPALRDHPEDTPLLAGHFWGGIRSGRERLPDDVTAMLREYPWRGNARELRGFLAYVAALASHRAPSVRLVKAAFAEWTGVWPGHRDR